MDTATLAFAETLVLNAGTAPPLLLRAGGSLDDSGCWSSELAEELAEEAPVPQPAYDDASARALLAAWLRSGAWAAAVERGLLSLSALREGELAVSFPRPAPPGCSTVPFTARLWLKNGVPLRASWASAQGGEERWDWAAWPDGAVCTQPTGEQAHFWVGDTVLPPRAAPLEPPAAWRAAEVPACRAAGGQLLVQARLGEAARWFVLDPETEGASVTPAASDGLRSAGRAAQPGLGGAVAGALLRAAVSLGPLRTPPLSLLQLSLDGVVQAPDGSPLGGVLGGAILRRCVLEVRAPARRHGARTPPPLSLWLHPPGAYSPPPHLNWLPLVTLDGAPHILCDYALDSGVDSSEPPRSGLFRLALATGGCGALLGAATAAAASFAGRTQALAPSGLLAAPGSQQGRLAAIAEGELLSGRLPFLRVGGADGVTFPSVRCLTHAGPDPAHLALSRHAHGLLCADLFRDTLLVLDLAGGRLALARLSEPD